MNNKIGTNFGPFIKRNSLFDVLKKTAQAGFEAADFSLTRTYGVERENEENFYKDVKKLSDDLGLYLAQGHTPFSRGDYSKEYFLGDEWFNAQCDSIRRASYLGIPWVVIHPFTHHPKETESNRYTEEKRKEGFEINYKFYKRLKPVLNGYGVNCAIENLAENDFITNGHQPCSLYSSKELNDFLDYLADDKTFGVCLDTGHANLVAEEGVPAFIKNLGKRLKVLHLNDNFSEFLDVHLPPFYGDLPWGEIKDALVQIGYDGALCFECINRMPNDEFDMLFAEYIYKTAKLIFDRK
ncbi:MAG: sugar phosphate isomerase/epimerase [Clostridia bacterium]|nr:sugar phosphate isomerase/epimerase [Clostridia bacterium]